jgi:hypothetical protein
LRRDAAPEPDFQILTHPDATAMAAKPETPSTTLNYTHGCNHNGCNKKTKCNPLATKLHTTSKQTACRLQTDVCSKQSLCLHLTSGNQFAIIMHAP